MPESEKNEIIKAIKDFSLPKYNEIPNVGLYLEQTAKYISEYLKPILETAVTGSMISNYVKKGLLSNPIKKQYSREQIAYLLFIAVAKTVLSMEDIKLLIETQKQTYDSEIAYNYFETELKKVLLYVFGMESSLEAIGEDSSEQKAILRNLIIAVSHKVYLEKSFSLLRNSK